MPCPGRGIGDPRTFHTEPWGRSDVDEGQRRRMLPSCAICKVQLTDEPARILASDPNRR